MKKTAKVLCLLLAVLMLATLAAACDKNEGDTSSAATSNATSSGGESRSRGLGDVYKRQGKAAGSGLKKRIGMG